MESLRPLSAPPDIVFKQTAFHIPHEANVEQLFSRAGLLSDPNMDPDYLGMLTSISMSKSAYKPTCAEIKTKSFDKYRGPSDLAMMMLLLLSLSSK